MCVMCELSEIRKNLRAKHKFLDIKMLYTWFFTAFGIFLKWSKSPI